MDLSKPINQHQQNAQNLAGKTTLSFLILQASIKSNITAQWMYLKVTTKGYYCYIKSDTLHERS